MCRCLHRTKDDGVIFWRTQRRDNTDLPDGTEVTRPINEDDALVPHQKEADQLGAYFDAAHAACPDTDDRQEPSSPLSEAQPSTNRTDEPNTSTPAEPTPLTRNCRMPTHRRPPTIPCIHAPPLVIGRRPSLHYNPSSNRIFPHPGQRTDDLLTSFSMQEPSSSSSLCG